MRRSPFELAGVAFAQRVQPLLLPGDLVAHLVDALGNLIHRLGGLVTRAVFLHRIRVQFFQPRFQRDEVARRLLRVAFGGGQAFVDLSQRFGDPPRIGFQQVQPVAHGVPLALGIVAAVAFQRDHTLLLVEPPRDLLARGLRGLQFPLGRLRGLLCLRQALVTLADLLRQVARPVRESSARALQASSAAFRT